MRRRDVERFAGLLRVRKLQEDQRAERLAEVRRRLMQARRKRDDILDQQRRAVGEAARRSTKMFSAQEVGAYFLYERYLAEQAVKADADIVELENEESRRLNEVREAGKERRIAEKLHERQHEAFAGMLDELDQKLSDEAAVVRAALSKDGRAWSENELDGRPKDARTGEARS
jgi:flagellar export protein FliJ